MRTSRLAFAIALVASSLVDAMPTSSFRSPFHHARSHKRDSSPKLVVAHHMVGNTYPYTQEDWASDIQAAHSAGIDGFALNIGTDDWQPSQVASAYVVLHPFFASILIVDTVIKPLLHPVRTSSYSFLLI